MPSAQLAQIVLAVFFLNSGFRGIDEEIPDAREAGRGWLSLSLRGLVDERF
jgi:hypothetical protein